MESEAAAENVARTDNGHGIKPFLSLSLYALKLTNLFIALGGKIGYNQADAKMRKPLWPEFVSFLQSVCYT